MAGHPEMSTEETLGWPASCRGSLAMFVRSTLRRHQGRRQAKRFYRPQIERLESRELLSVDAWPMRQGDIWNTGRADFDVPDSRLNDQLFDIFRWQTRTPGSPNDGALTSTSMVFYDGAGPNGADLVAGGYHWPKGVQGMDRHTGELFWAALTDGGEAIGANTPAFSNDGSVIYVTNDGPKSTQYPNGRSLMAFWAESGPTSFWHNGGDPQAEPGIEFSPKVAPDGRIFLHHWAGPPTALTDLGNSLRETWLAASPQTAGFSNPALYESNGLRVIAVGDWGLVNAFDGASGDELWSTATDVPFNADPTVDPANGHVYAPAGNDDIFIVGLDQNGQPLWPTVAAPVFDWVDGVNHGQRALSTGCLSFDGSTYYFQTVSFESDGRLYAINTVDGTVKWSFETQSTGWDFVASSPIVTSDGVVIVGNNDGDTYFAIRDAGDHGELVDSLTVDAAGWARASATLSNDGLLYLPLRTVQIAGSAGAERPAYKVQNLFTAIDLSAGATLPLYPPGGQRAVAQNHAVQIEWESLPVPAGYFGHYAVYRSTAPFTTVAGLTPLATIDEIGTTEYLDATAENGTGYYYAVTAVSDSGGEVEEVASIGRRVPRDETDLQVVAIARSPEFPRYWPDYQGHEVTEPGGFGPYYFTSSNGLLGGQTSADPRFPGVGDSVTYTATVRNRGTNPVQGSVNGTWTVDGNSAASAAQNVDLSPDETVQFVTTLPWDGQPHEIAFAIDAADARAANNRLVSDTMAVPLLTYVDRSFVESFRDEWSPAYPQATTDDVLDWLNSHMDRFNELFAEAGVQKRVHYGVLQVIDDQTPDPPLDPATSPYGVFPFRYRAGVDGDLRLSGYYDLADDFDYGLLHEIGHQLGLIDIYQLGVDPSQNEVSYRGYRPAPDLMNGCDHFLSPASALAMEHWLHDVHGYYGQYLYNIPQTMKLRLLDYRGQPLANAQVTMYQMTERPGQGKVIANQPKASGLTDADGYFTLPNVDIDESLVPPVGTGDVLHDNPFGYVAVVGTNGVLHFKVEKDGATDFAWLDITEANVAYWTGHETQAVFDRQLALGMPVQTQPPADMAEPSAGAWAAWADGATASATYDTARKTTGDASLHFVTDGGFDTYVRYPQDFNARWDLSSVASLTLSVYADNPNVYRFQSSSPWIRLVDADGDFYQYQYFVDGSPIDFLNEAIGSWQTYRFPLRAAGPDPSGNSQGWIRTAQGTPDLTRMHLLEFHADTWHYGFELWLDGVRFESGPTALSDQFNVVKSQKLTVSPTAGLLKNDAFVPGVSTSAILVNGPQHGTLDLRPDGSFTYQPQAGYLGSDHFLYKLSDGQHESVSADVDLAVTVPELANFRLFTDATLTTAGLMGSYVDRSLRSYAPQDDWRQTQTIAGTHVDPQLDFIGLSWGPQADVGLTHGLDNNWEDFSVQWDGYLKVVGDPLSLWTRSDDGSRMWIDINHDGAFDSVGVEFIDNHWGTGQTPTDGPKSQYLAPGVYRVRVQYEETYGGNMLQLLASSPPLVRAAYVIPSNRTPQPDGVENLQHSLRLFQDWFRDQMDRNGFNSKTLRIETESDGVTPAVHVVSVDPTDESLRASPWDNISAAVTEAGIPLWTEEQVWLLVPEIHVQFPDGSIQGRVDGVAANWPAHTGVIMASATGLAYSSADDLSDNRVYHGRILPAIGPYPLVQDVSFPWLDGTTISSLSSSWSGATLHAMTQILELPYERRNGWDEFNGNLRNQVPHGLRGALYPALYPNDDTYLGYGQALTLSVSPFFGSRQAGAERQSPEVSMHTVGEVAPVDGLLQISFSASDDTGLASAVLVVDGGQVEELRLRGREANAVFATWSYQPGVTSRFQVIVYDVFGNPRRVETEVTPLAGLNSAPHPHIRLLGNTTPRINQSVTLDARQSWDWDVGDGAMTVEWDLDGDGVFDSAPTQFRRLVTSYDAVGTHLVRARLTDPSGAQSISAPLPIRVINPWHNDLNPFDATGEGELTPNDPLVLINHINAHPNDSILPPIPVSPPPFLDVNGDGWCTPGDVLAVINKINAGLAAAESEGIAPDSAWTVEIVASMPPAPTDGSEAVGQTAMPGEWPAAASGFAWDKVRGGSSAAVDDSRYTAPSPGSSDSLKPIARRVRSQRSLQDRDAVFSRWGERNDPWLDSEERGFQF